MGHRFAEIAFTPNVRRIQTEQGSRDAYARLEKGPDSNDTLGPKESDFIAARDSFYMASVTETGWPYIQHRGGPSGFLKVLDERTIGFADYRGNRQYVTVGNLASVDRVALILLDYPHRRRLKLLGRARVIDPLIDRSLLERLEIPTYKARVERGIAIRIEAFDWNCPQHIVPRFAQGEIGEIVRPLQDRIAELEAEIRSLRNAQPLR